MCKPTVASSAGEEVRCRIRAAGHWERLVPEATVNVVREILASNSERLRTP